MFTSPSGTTTEEIWDESEEENELGPVEINIDDEVIRVPVQPKRGFRPIDKANAAIVGPEVLHSFPLNFKFILPESTTIGEMIGKPSDATMKEMAGILGINDQTRNKYSYWILDVTQEMIVAAQKLGMSQINQVNTLNWFLFTLKQIQLTSLSRKDFFVRLEEMLLTAEKMMVTLGTENVPNPCDVLATQDKNAFFVYYPKGTIKEPETKLPITPNTTKLKMRQSRMSTASKDKSKRKEVQKEIIEVVEEEYEEEEGEFFDPSPPAITEKELLIMTQLLYDIFADRLAYEIIRDVFWEEPLIEVIRISERFLIPKFLAPDNIDVKSIGQELFFPERPIIIEELLQPGEKPSDLSDEEKMKRLQEAELLRATDRFIQPLADAIDSNYFRRIYPDIKGISKFVFVKRKNMDQYRQNYLGRKPSPGKAQGGVIKAKAGSGHRKSSKRQSKSGGKRKSTAKRQSMKRKSKAK